MINIISKREFRIVNELQLLTGVMTEDISYMCFLLLKDGTYFNNVKTQEEIKEENLKKEVNDKINEIGVTTFADLLNSF